MPRLISSMRCGKCAWQVWKSDQVERIAMTGLSLKSSSEKPPCLMRRCLCGPTGLGAENQRWLRSSPTVLRLTATLVSLFSRVRIGASR